MNMTDRKQGSKSKAATTTTTAATPATTARTTARTTKRGRGAAELELQSLGRWQQKQQQQ